MKVGKEIKIGICAVISVIVIYLGILFLKGLSLFDNDVSYFVKTSDVQGMQVSSDVRANGLAVGKVKAISFTSDKTSLIVELSIDPSFPIPKGTTVFMTKEMLGSAMMNLRLGPNPGDCLAPGDTISGEPGADLMTAAGQMVPQVQAMLPKLDSILSAVNTITNDPALLASLHNMEDISSELKTTIGTTSAQVNGLLGNDVPKLLSKTDVICTNLEQTTGSLAQIDLVGMANKADHAMTNMDAMTAKMNAAMNDKNTSIGMLMNDNSIMLHLDTTMQNSALLLEDFRLHPKRYVHFSLFGKKDK